MSDPNVKRRCSLLKLHDPVEATNVEKTIPSSEDLKKNYEKMKEMNIEDMSRYLEELTDEDNINPSIKAFSNLSEKRVEKLRELFPKETE